jgi:hypothetical protein
MLSVKQIVFITVIPLVIAACCHSANDSIVENSTAVEKQTSTIAKSQRGNADIENQLQAIVLGNPHIDAADAIKSGTPYLWAYSSRSGKIIPGIPNQSDDLVKKVKSRTAPGMGDVIYSDKHQKLRRQFVEYATIYNQSILQALEK